MYVEIVDVWNGDDGEPIIFHGYTLTTKILLSDVLVAIKEYAFKKSQYPVILSIENHCDLEQQKKMAQHFINILGSKNIHLNLKSIDNTFVFIR